MAPWRLAAGGATQLTLRLVELKLTRCTSWGGADGAVGGGEHNHTEGGTDQANKKITKKTGKHKVKLEAFWTVVNIIIKM